MKPYCFCPPIDGNLYVELPSQNQLLTFLLQQKWRGKANFRTLHGYVPYFGGGVAFDFLSLFLRGARPSWYAVGRYDDAVQALVEDGIFDTYLDAEMHHSIYPQECEWTAPAGFRFSFDDIKFIWLGEQVGSPLKTLQILNYLEEILPSHVEIWDEPPPMLGNNNPCKNKNRQLQKNPDPQEDSQENSQKYDELEVITEKAKNILEHEFDRRNWPPLLREYRLYGVWWKMAPNVAATIMRGNSFQLDYQKGGKRAKYDRFYWTTHKGRVSKYFFALEDAIAWYINTLQADLDRAREKVDLD